MVLVQLAFPPHWASSILHSSTSKWKQSDRLRTEYTAKPSKAEPENRNKAFGVSSVRYDDGPTKELRRFHGRVRGNRQIPQKGVGGLTSEFVLSTNEHERTLVIQRQFVKSTNEHEYDVVDSTPARENNERTGNDVGDS